MKQLHYSVVTLTNVRVQELRIEAFRCRPWIPTYVGMTTGNVASDGASSASERGAGDA